ncbi:class I SAM-dependent methyltransferase [Blastopirellula marina]|nr:class I SAM-dependent methyltransferase [Blastopirellula marina]
MHAEMKQTCPICHSTEWKAEYQGPVRDGVFGKYDDGIVWKCDGCGVSHLPPKEENLTDYYQSDEYREDVGEHADPQDYFSRHDDEQFDKARFLKGTSFRGKVIADIGCAGGSFLDVAKGLAKASIAIEPGKSYHASLRERGHHVYDSLESAAEQWQGQVDVAVCFSVIEHVLDPVEFLTGIRKLLTPDGVLVLSTPNQRDALLDFSGNPYRSFFYRRVHPWYFDEDCLRLASTKSGMTFEPQYVQRFSFANFAAWLREGKPTGNAHEAALGPVFDDVWKSTLETQKKSDYLYGFCRPAA